MIKNDVFVIGIGLGGERVGYDFQQRNYSSYLINGSGQDNKTLPDAKNMLVLEALLHLNQQNHIIVVSFVRRIL